MLAVSIFPSLESHSQSVRKSLSESVCVGAHENVGDDEVHHFND